MIEKPRTKKPLEIFEDSTIRALTQKSIESNSKHTLDMAPFIELYGKKAVVDDYNEIAKRMSGHLKEGLTNSEKLGFIFEAAFLDISSTHQWFGKNSEIVHSSKYDDIINGVDMVATMLQEEVGSRHLAIASDLTFSYPNANSKFHAIVNNIRNGKMAKMKYFHSDLLGFTGQKTNIPRTVIALDAKNLNILLKNWMKEPELAQREFGAIILRQIESQSESFSALAKETFGDGNIISKAYDGARIAVSTLLENEYPDNVPEDTIANALQQQCSALLQTSRG